MTSICMYFQVHQPYIFRNYSFFDIGANPFYENEDLNCEKLLKLARECYLPANQRLLESIREHKGKFKVSFSISGTALELFEKHVPEVIESFQELAETGCVDFLAESYYHSLAFLYSREEFQEQVELHAKKIQRLFNIKPTVFRNTELIYNNELAQWAEKAGYKGILADGADFILAWRSPNKVYIPEGCADIKLFMRNNSLSDDIALRFSDSTWNQYPLDADKYASWIHKEEGEIINLFFPYENFGIHHKAESGIFNFLRALPSEILKNTNYAFKTLSEALSLKAEARMNVPNLLSWTDSEKDLNSWLGNDMQQDSLNTCYSLELNIKQSQDENLLKMWRILQGAEHVQAMSTKWLSSPWLAPYQVPYDSPYDAYINFMNIFSDISLRVEDKTKKLKKEIPETKTEETCIQEVKNENSTLKIQEKNEITEDLLQNGKKAKRSIFNFSKKILKNK